MGDEPRYRSYGESEEARRLRSGSTAYLGSEAGQDQSLGVAR